MPDEVAMFIDFENLRYGLLNTTGQEPDLAALVEKAKKYGRPPVMRAYADFTEHPQGLSRRLQVVGIEAINVPVKRSTFTSGGKSVERIKSAADMVLALDAMIEAVECDGDGRCKTFLLVAGDRDYVKLVTQVRNRFGQRVVIAGVPGSVATDLVDAAGEADPIEVVEYMPADMVAVKKALVDMVAKGPAPLKYWRPSRSLTNGPRMDARACLALQRRSVMPLANFGTLGSLSRRISRIRRRGKKSLRSYLTRSGHRSWDALIRTTQNSPPHEGLGKTREVSSTLPKT